MHINPGSSYYLQTLVFKSLLSYINIYNQRQELIFINDSERSLHVFSAMSLERSI